MKYNIFFEKHSDDVYHSERLDNWKKESVVPRIDDTVFMKVVGWKTVVSVGFSVVENGKRLVYISVK